MDVPESEFVGSAVLRACIGGLSGVARVTVPGDVGYLFFRKGQIVYARTLELDGEKAALAVLGWSRGAFELCERRWPVGPAIETPWRELFQKAEVEPVRRPASIAPPAPVTTATPAAAQKTAARPTVNERAVAPLKPQPLTYSSAMIAESRLNHYVRFSRDGTPKGEFGDVKALREALIHGLRAADEIGAALAAGPALVVEARASDSVGLLVRSADETAALRGDGATLSAILRACGL
jgi:hypothetical protein